MTDPIVPPVEPSNPPVTVDREAHNAILQELAKAQKLNSDMRGEIDNLKLTTHKDKDDWKTVAQIKEQEAEEIKAKYKGLQSAVINAEKNKKLSEAAIKAGINPVALPDLELLDLPEVTVQTTNNGKILVEGADLAIQKLKTLRPHWFGTQVPGINPETPNTFPANPNSITLQMLQTANDTFNKTKSDSDKKIYENLLMKYNAQKQRA